VRNKAFGRLRGMDEMHCLSVFFPALGLILSAVILGIICLANTGAPTTSDWFDSFSVGFTVVFILSMLEYQWMVTVPARLCRYGSTFNPNDFAAAKGKLINGKHTNILLTALINFVNGIVKLAT
jgi:hypothetical protein